MTACAHTVPIPVGGRGLGTGPPPDVAHIVVTRPVRPGVRARRAAPSRGPRRQPRAARRDRAARRRARRRRRLRLGGAHERRTAPASCVGECAVSRSESRRSGRATADAFGGADVVATTSTQEGLLEAIPRPVGRVLFAAAEGARPLLPEALGADVVSLYRTVELSSRQVAAERSRRSRVALRRACVRSPRRRDTRRDHRAGDDAGRRRGRRPGARRGGERATSTACVAAVERALGSP